MASLDEDLLHHGLALAPMAPAPLAAGTAIGTGVLGASPTTGTQDFVLPALGPVGVTTIVFTDAQGTVTLSNLLPAPANRFDKWEPYATPIGAGDRRLGSGAYDFFEFRVDYGVKFELSKIPRSQQGNVIRLLRWLQEGGTVAVNTGDATGASYPTCSLAPDAKPSFTMTDRDNIEYSLALDLIRTDVTPAPMICSYAGGR